MDEVKLPDKLKKIDRNIEFVIDRLEHAEDCYRRSDTGCIAYIWHARRDLQELKGKLSEAISDSEEASKTSDVGVYAFIENDVAIKLEGDCLSQALDCSVIEIGGGYAVIGKSSEGKVCVPFSRITHIAEIKEKKEDKEE